MPKKKTGRPIQLPQKKYITKRLMVMSIQVDKYIYKHKPITMSQAQTYLREAMSYKELCLADVRSLQVIEKLTRCMKAIITEINSNESCNSVTETLLEDNHGYNYAPSPVYSLPDEDRTQMIQCMQNELHNDIPYNNNDTVEIVDLDESGRDSEQIVTQPFDMSAFMNQAQSESGSVKALRSVIIQNDAQTNTENDIFKDNVTLNNDNMSNYIGSQSLLKNVEADIAHGFVKPNIEASHDKNNKINEGINDTVQNKESDMFKASHNFACGQGISEVDKEVNMIMKAKETNAVAIVLPKDLTAVNIPRETDKITELTKSIKHFNIQNNFTEITKTNEAVNKPRKRCKAKNVNSKEIDKDVKKDNKRNTEKTPKSNNRKNKSKNTKNKFDTVPLTSIENNSAMENIPLNTQSQKLVKEAPKVVKNIEYDLSWVENIRYVRKINIYEYDPTFNSINDSFWENCFMPENWNETDFDF